ncbi:MAG: TfoX/Sxy family protein [Bacteroidetes bacterium]|nr:TfoX/Sxy family protein [Bacteroidota bacterium]
MAYNEGLAQRIREMLTGRDDVVEKKMFGGLCFMVRGHMSFGIIKDELMVRVGKEAYEKSLAQPHAREMDFTGRSLKGMVYVAPEGFESDADLAAWVGKGTANAESLPPK